MVTQQRNRLLVGGAVAAALVFLYVWLRPPAPAATAPAARAARAEARGRAVARIGLDRLAAPPPSSENTAQRDLFAYGVEPTPPPPPPPVQQATVDTEPTPPPVPTLPPLPPLNVKYIGSLEAKPGIRVAFFQTEKKDIVTGQVGEVVMNRFKVVKIGYESADIQEVGMDHVRRLPLRGGS
jgi:hypothetical protein